MDSPKSTTSDGGSDSGRHTPKPSRKFYWTKLSEASRSPQMCGITDTEEFSWGDSPEPLKIEVDVIISKPQKIEPSETPVSHRKMRSSRHKRASVVTDQDLAAIKELKRVICSNKGLAPDGVKNESTLCQAQGTEPPQHINVELNGIAMKDQDASKQAQVVSGNSITSNTSVHLSESSVDSALQSFLQEEDDAWLSQVDVNNASRTPHRVKGGFVKSLSENQLESPSRENTFRRSSSFQLTVPTSLPSNKTDKNAHSLPPQSKALEQNDDSNLSTTGGPQPLKKQKSFHIDNNCNPTQYTAEQIEQKRLQALYRRDFREIERKKLEAQKRLNERRLRLAIGNTKR